MVVDLLLVWWLMLHWIMLVLLLQVVTAWLLVGCLCCELIGLIVVFGGVCFSWIGLFG